ncbi:hypothetical protein JJJ17_09315 [Paracoccus caeni]|uniref:Uncharacterized protein n=1 Tax=Paracoccus caeni TaxID=657651 RepID=A0A934W0A5_9RHOB|nr:hypothetical protein [Paracoccus caeni]MBK4216123.1 hypothetical protein [Paracoccus caeni]
MKRIWTSLLILAFATPTHSAGSNQNCGGCHAMLRDQAEMRAQSLSEMDTQSYAESFFDEADSSDATDSSGSSTAGKVSKKAVTAVARRAAGPTVGYYAGKVFGERIGSKVGSILGGGAMGLGVGVFLTPTEIGCGTGEHCSR